MRKRAVCRLTAHGILSAIICCLLPMMVAGMWFAAARFPSAPGRVSTMVPAEIDDHFIAETAAKVQLPAKTEPAKAIHGVKQQFAQEGPVSASEAGFTTTKTPVEVAHVVSLIKCGKSVDGLLDAAAVLRHSIHQQSVHNHGRSKYSYRMYAIVHEDCQSHAIILRRLGYVTLIRPNPVQLSEIKGEFYRTHVIHENCCGHKEFIKLYAYELEQHPIVIHWDLDIVVLQPMDDLFDAMLYSKESPEGQKARARIELQHPEESLPDVIDAYITKDITSAFPWEKVQGVQGGFVVARPSKEVFKKYLAFIREGNYTRGRGKGTGWDGLGYGGFQGAMAYQGAVAYYYDQLHRTKAVELNVCRWNQVVADVIWRGPQGMQHHLQCRDYPRDGNHKTNTKCEDCRVTPIELTKTVHYTACKKPWECIVPYPRQAKDTSQQYRLNHLTNRTTCGKLFTKWFELRRDLEHKLEQATKWRPSQHDGEFYPDYFLGYCTKRGGYTSMTPPPEDFDMKTIYGI